MYYFVPPVVQIWNTDPQVAEPSVGESVTSTSRVAPAAIVERPIVERVVLVKPTVRRECGGVRDAFDVGWIIRVCVAEDFEGGEGQRC